uniref:Telomerase Cajal body protein 1 n=1 Tax=Phallusia mammillata TaxID=59560 RepID=A0A6F9DXL3_9ASCI|nr:telomerase Cajal body protein 1-like [Phallusia mammillata]
MLEYSHVFQLSFTLVNVWYINTMSNDIECTMEFLLQNVANNEMQVALETDYVSSAVINEIPGPIETAANKIPSSIITEFSIEKALQFASTPTAKVIATIHLEKNPESFTHKLVAQSKNYNKGNFMKGCKWSPDGLCFLTNSNDNSLRLFNTPSELLNNNYKNEQPYELKECFSVKEPETVYDFCWWPLMNSQSPETCCFLTTSRDQPVHLWDAFNGSLRASYRSINNVDELQAAHSVCFSPDGQQLLCGYRKQVCLFYTDRPGAKFERWKTVKAKPCKSVQNNIISCVEFGPDGSMFACGCYDRTIGIYSPNNGKRLELVTAHSSGVTCLKFSADGNRLYSGARKDGSIKCWDMRWLNTPLLQFNRQVTTNQRIHFDLVYNGEILKETELIAGSTDGNIVLWNLKEAIPEAETDVANCQVLDTQPVYAFKGHNDCVNGCSVHPYLPILLTSSGQRHFANPVDSDDEDTETLLSQNNINEENMIKLWYIYH